MFGVALTLVSIYYIARCVARRYQQDVHRLPSPVSAIDLLNLMGRMRTRCGVPGSCVHALTILPPAAQARELAMGPRACHLRRRGGRDVHQVGCCLRCVLQDQRRTSAPRHRAFLISFLPSFVLSCVACVPCRSSRQTMQPSSTSSRTLTIMVRAVTCHLRPASLRGPSELPHRARACTTSLL